MNQPNFKQTKPVRCEKCQGFIFKDGLMMMKNSDLAIHGQPGHTFNVAVMICVNCGKIQPTSVMPPDLKEIIKKLESPMQEMKQNHNK